MEDEGNMEDDFDFIRDMQGQGAQREEDDDDEDEEDMDQQSKLQRARELHRTQLLK